MSSNTNIDWVEDMALRLICKVGGIPFKGLIVLVGVNPRHGKTWHPLIEIIIKRLVGCNDIFLLFDGRAVLVNVMLFSIPIYLICIYKASKKL